MVITGFPRSGSSLLLLLLAGTVSNQRVYAERESGPKRGWDITKCPFELTRRTHNPRDVLLTVRDPRGVVTSNSHPFFDGRYVFGWQRGQGQSITGLEKHWEAMKPYLDEALIVRYEDLLADPDGTQRRIGERFNLEYSRPFTEWPRGFHIDRYWKERGLGAVTQLRPPRTEYDPVRVAEMEACPGFKECCRALGY